MAVHISRGLLLAASGSSSTPFLFHTRTLAPLSQSLYRSTRGLQQYSTNHVSNKDDGHDSSSSRLEDETSDTSPEKPGSSTAGRPFPRRSYLQKRGTVIAQTNERELGPSDRNSVEDSSDSVPIASDISSVTSHTESAPSPTAKDAPAAPRSFLRQRASSVIRSKPARPKQASPRKPLQTMTSHEKLIFADLLGQLDIKRHAPAETVEDLSNKQKEAKTSPSRRGNPESINELLTMFDSLMKDAQKSEKRDAPTRTESKIPQETGTSVDIPDGSNKICLSDLGFSEPASYSRHETMITVMDAVEMVVKKEAEKIEFELFQAIEDDRGDLGLWEVCKERIFSMLQHVDGNVSTEPSSVAGTLPDAFPTAGTEQPSSETSTGPLKIPKVVPIQPVIARLYPRTLLIAFRLLNTHFPDSQLISQFRSSIKAQGRTSAVLGTSKALFDEMIYFHWYGCHDLPAVVSSLRDMDIHGLDLSFKSRNLLQDIVRERFRDLKAARAAGEQDDSFWDLPPNRKAFEELAMPGGWLTRLKQYARERRMRQAQR